jgi:surface antigen
MLAKKWMVLTKLCLTLVCTNVDAQSWERPHHNPFAGQLNGTAWFLGKIFETRMDKNDQAFHSQAVYHALNNSNDGEDVTWFNDREGSQGRARIVYTHPSPGGWCRRVYSFVVFKNITKTYEDTACYNTHTNTWSWIYK